MRAKNARVILLYNFKRPKNVESEINKMCGINSYF